MLLKKFKYIILLLVFHGCCDPITRISPIQSKPFSKIKKIGLITTGLTAAAAAAAFAGYKWWYRPKYKLYQNKSKQLQEAAYALLEQYKKEIPKLEENVNPENFAIVYAHGVGANKEQIKYYQEAPKYLGKEYVHKPKPGQEITILPAPVLPTSVKNINAQNFPCASNLTIKNRFVDMPFEYINLNNPAQCSLAGKNEINALYERCKKIVEKNSKAKIILFGASMGAATILNFLGSVGPELARTSEEQERATLIKNNIAAAIVEAPFADIESVGPEFLRPIQGAVRHAIIKATYAWQLDPTQSSPLSTIEWIRKDLPILLIHSTKDRQVPIRNAHLLLNSLLSSRHTKVNYIELKHTRHARYLNDKRDAIKYINGVSKFLQENNLPFNPEALGMVIVEPL